MVPDRTLLHLMADIEKEPERALNTELPPADLRALRSLKIRPSEFSDIERRLAARPQSWGPNSNETKKAVSIFSYTGWPTNSTGNDGDFFVDELSNMLYGPKAKGIWPEEGVPAVGLCKRSWFGINVAPIRTKPLRAKESALKRTISALLRMLSVIRTRRRLDNHSIYGLK